ncbi:hypothetical protein SARC_05276 [Sphaeroforma arctica JP610]|uniref:tRNA (cytosine(38)-C(5))-methyltransferase n=1 Tax=Sphaeroforma arctica JP610 TaxID=667725 RepID=A0A0L0G0R7_9EUKA|nr:hypothetical protein SARC_05276 [Sphaeroforma arctica JP610]KNC82444.1 hypothetical protein SARC_05276 [Sphaeroforma arctica JP610]|eukprot:XP_014156346.1 hypothetical protein SARC_05276 [Sphaeroforma arctica JP610]
MEGLRVSEFYSGIGGLHCAFETCGTKGKVLHAFDINTAANEVYKHNFPDTTVHQRNLTSFSIANHNAMPADVWLMSPPCQPYTRQGKQMGSKDMRAQSFIHLVDLLGNLDTPPSYLLMENVFGFEKSDTHEVLVAQLTKLNYTYQEFLLTPDQFGIPNSRLRYFLLAKRAPRALLDIGLRSRQSFQALKNALQFTIAPCDVGVIQTTIPGDGECFPSPQHHNYHYTTKADVGTSDESNTTEGGNPAIDVAEQTAEADDKNKTTIAPAKRSCDSPVVRERDPESWKRQKTGSAQCKALSHFLQSSEELAGDRMAPGFIAEKVVVQKGPVWDIVVPTDTRSCCFTKAYSKYHEGTGSVLQTNTEHSYVSAFEPIMEARRISNENKRAQFEESKASSSHTPAETHTQEQSQSQSQSETEPQTSAQSLVDGKEVPPTESDIGTELQTQSKAKIETTEETAADKSPAVAKGIMSEVPREQIDAVMALGLRFLSPREIARLHCFPDTMTFPKSINRNSAYKLLGNSLNVRVVSRLLTYMFDSQKEQ